MKKITLTLLALVCALCCAFGLAACGGGGDNTNANLLTEAEWKENFNAAINAPDYGFQQSHYDTTKGEYELDTEFMLNSANRSYYYLSYWNGYWGDASNLSILFKKDGIYYEHYNSVDGEHLIFGTQTRTAAEFDEIEEEDYLSWNAIVEQALIFCRDKFSDFTTVAGMTYDAQNITVTIHNPFTEGDQAFTVGKATVMFENKKLINLELYDIEVDGVESKMYWNYSVGVNVYLQGAIDDVTLPQIKGANYKLTEVNGSSSASDVTANEGKYIKWKNDGTLEGDISINGLNIADGTMTCGDNGIVVTIGEYTLTGYCVYQNGETTMELTLVIDENREARYTFTLNS